MLRFNTHNLSKMFPLVLLTSLSPGLFAQKHKKPNIVFFLVDDMGWMDIGANGSAFYETPNIDKLAKEGIRFTNAYAASPVCSPTRASILTGKHPARIHLTQYIGGPGNPDYVRNLPLEEVLFPELLKSAGYTNIFLGKWHLNNLQGEGTFWPEKQGFDKNVAGHWRGGLYIPDNYFSPWNIPNLENGPAGEYMTDRLAQESVNFIDTIANRPFLLYFSFYSVHAPFNAPAERVERFAKKQNNLGLTDADRFGEEMSDVKPFKFRKAQDHPTYAAMVQSVDLAVGKVLSKLTEKGLLDNTIILFFSDNGGLSTSEGTPTANTPLRMGKGWVYEGGLRVPAIIKWPGKVIPGSVSDALITSMDFYPTLLDVAGVPKRPDLHKDGKSLVPLLTGKDTKVHDELYFHYPHRSNQRGGPSGAIRDGDYKLIISFSDNHLELYNLRDDVGEKKDLANEFPQVRDRLYQKLKKWWTEVDARFPENYTNK